MPPWPCRCLHSPSPSGQQFSHLTLSLLIHLANDVQAITWPHVISSFLFNFLSHVEPFPGSRDSISIKSLLARFMLPLGNSNFSSLTFPWHPILARSSTQQFPSTPTCAFTLWRITLMLLLSTILSMLSYTIVCLMGLPFCQSISACSRLNLL